MVDHRGKILNKKTGRWVKKTGSIGKKILKKKSKTSRAPRGLGISKMSDCRSSNVALQKKCVKLNNALLNRKRGTKNAQGRYVRSRYYVDGDKVRKSSWTSADR